MLEAFKSFIGKNSLFHPRNQILLAVSGGMDSTAMCELFHQAGFHFGIAHCNFRLRGADSDRDEEFVAGLARKYKCPFFVARFDTQAYAEEKGISVQMAARDLRYEWFRKISEEHGYDYIATAHHLDDQLETFFINLSRSTGIAGFHGIPQKQGNIIRPLMFTWRKEIEEFIRKEKLLFREDRSNEENKYLRNRIRHQLYPVLTGIHPDFPRTLSENINRIRETEAIYRVAIEEAKKKLLTVADDRILISIRELNKLAYPEAYLFEILSPYGFNYAVTRNIAGSLFEKPGATFFSSSHRVVRDREYLILTPAETVKGKNRIPSITEFRIPENRSSISNPVKLSIKKVPASKTFRIDPSPEAAYLDYSKLQFPLILRPWKPGDAFYPFGKNIRKKISDFFIDEKVPRPDKEKAWLLCSGNRIAWVVGYRIDHRFRVTRRTTEVLVLKKRK